MPKELNPTKIELLQPRSKISPNVEGKISPERKRIVETEDVIVTDEYSPGPSFLAKAACVLNPTIAALEAMNQTGWESKHRVTVYDAKTGLPNYELAYNGDRKPTLEEVALWDYRTTPDPDEKKSPLVGLKKTAIKITGNDFLAVTNISDASKTFHDVMSGQVELQASNGKIKDNPKIRKIVGDVVNQLARVPELSHLQKVKKKFRR